MSLLKKTIVLSNKKINGHITVVKIGSSIGAKVILVDSLDVGTLYLKIGSNKTTEHIIKGKRAEIALNDSGFSQNDEIGAIIMANNGIYATGGDYKNIKVDLDFSAKKDEDEKIIKGNSAKFEQESEDYFNYKDEKEDNEEDFYEKYIKKPQIQDYIKEKKEEKTKGDKENIFDFVNPQYKGNNFYVKQKNKFDEIFTIYPKNEELERYIDDSKWATINYDGDDYYVVGLLKSNDVVTHIVYGVPGISGIYPPNETLEISDWLPTPTRENKKRGYWLIFQDAFSGEITKI